MRDVVPTSPQSKRFHFRYRHKKVWEPICFILVTGSRIASGMDKTIAPHQEVYIVHLHDEYISNVWVLLLSSSFQFQICEICYKKIISITPFR